MEFVIYVSGSFYSQNFKDLIPNNKLSKLILYFLCINLQLAILYVTDLNSLSINRYYTAVKPDILSIFIERPSLDNERFCSKVFNLSSAFQLAIDVLTIK